MALALETSEERFIRNLLRKVNSCSSAAVVLVGSAVRDSAMTDSSDIDILALGVEVPRPAPPRIQVIDLDETSLRKRLTDGDDFAQWAMRFGKPLAGRAYWRRLCDELLHMASWPNHERKRRQAAIRLAFAQELAAMGDVSSATEELRFAISHLARAELLERKVFPLARGELPEQMRAVGDEELATSLELLNSDGGPIRSEVLDTALQLASERLGDRVVDES